MTEEGKKLLLEEMSMEDKLEETRFEEFSSISSVDNKPLNSRSALTKNALVRQQLGNKSKIETNRRDE